MIPERFFDTYGYWAILVGTFFEGETVLILGGFVASRGYLNLPWVILAAFIGGLCGDQLFFFLGRRYSGRILASRPSWQYRAHRVHKLLERFQTWLILIYRFMYGFRSITPFVIGTSPIPYRRFILLNILAVRLWAASIGTGGYLIGGALEACIGDLKKYELEIVITITATGLGIWMVHFFRRGRQG